MIDTEPEDGESFVQPRIEGLPLLKGTPRQIAWALKIRAAVQAHEPSNPDLKIWTKTSFWIETYRSVLAGIATEET